MGKITWQMIYKDFRSRFPKLRKKIWDYRPYDYLKIELWSKDKSIVLIYDYLMKKCEIVRYE